MLRRSSRRISREQGVILIIVTLLLPVFIGLLALLFDIGRLFIIARQAQNVADVAATAGVNTLLKDVPSDPDAYKSVRLDQWLEIKPRVRVLLEEVKVSGVPPVLNTDFFDSPDGDATSPDRVKYQGDRLETAGSSSAQKLLVRIRRGVYCYNGTSIREFDLEANGATHYCIANMVTAETEVRNIGFAFSRLLGASFFQSLKRPATAHVRTIEAGNACGVPACSLYFDSGGTGALLDPGCP